jgi:hypothetical protein
MEDAARSKQYAYSAVRFSVCTDLLRSDQADHALQGVARLGAVTAHCGRSRTGDSYLIMDWGLSDGCVVGAFRHEYGMCAC